MMAKPYSHIRHTVVPWHLSLLSTFLQSKKYTKQQNSPATFTAVCVGTVAWLIYLYGCHCTHRRAYHSFSVQMPARSASTPAAQPCSPDLAASADNWPTWRPVHGAKTSADARAPLARSQNSIKISRRLGAILQTQSPFSRAAEKSWRWPCDTGFLVHDCGGYDGRRWLVRAASARDVTAPQNDAGSGQCYGSLFDFPLLYLLTLVFMFVSVLARNIIDIRAKKHIDLSSSRNWRKNNIFKKLLLIHVIFRPTDHYQTIETILFSISIFDCLIMFCRPKYYMDQKKFFFNILCFRHISTRGRKVNVFFYFYIVKIGLGIGGQVFLFFLAYV